MCEYEITSTTSTVLCAGGASVEAPHSLDSLIAYLVDGEGVRIRMPAPDLLAVSAPTVPASSLCGMLPSGSSAP